MRTDKTSRPSITVKVPDIEHSFVTGAMRYRKKMFIVEPTKSFQEDVGDILTHLTAPNNKSTWSKQVRISWRLLVKHDGVIITDLMPKLWEHLKDHLNSGSELLLLSDEKDGQDVEYIEVSHSSDAIVAEQQDAYRTIWIKYNVSIIEKTRKFLKENGCVVPDLLLESHIVQVIMSPFIPTSPCIDHLNLLGLSM